MEFIDVVHKLENKVWNLKEKFWDSKDKKERTILENEIRKYEEAIEKARKIEYELWKIKTSEEADKLKEQAEKEWKRYLENNEWELVELFSALMEEIREKAMFLYKLELRKELNKTYTTYLQAYCSLIPQKYSSKDELDLALKPRTKVKGRFKKTKWSIW